MLKILKLKSNQWLKVNTGEISTTVVKILSQLMEMSEPPGMLKRTPKVLLKPKISKLRSNQWLKVNTGETSITVVKILSQLMEMSEPPGMPKRMQKALLKQKKKIGLLEINLKSFLPSNKVPGDQLILLKKLHSVL